MNGVTKVLWTLAAIVAWPASCVPAEGDDWISELLKVRAEVCTAGEADRAATSEVLKGDSNAQRIEMDVKGLEEIWLAAEGVPDYTAARSAWCEAELVKMDGSVTRLADLKPFHAQVGWGEVLKGKDWTGGPLKVNGRPFAHGVFAHADSLLGYRLGRQYVTFRAWVGISNGGGGARFTVRSTPGAGGRIRQAAAKLAQRFPAQQALSGELLEAWARTTPDPTGTQTFVSAYVSRTAPRLRPRIAELKTKNAGEEDWLRLAGEAAQRAGAVKRLTLQIELLDPAAVKRAIEDLATTFPDTYPGAAFRERFAALNPDVKAIREGLKAGDEAATAAAEAWTALCRDALLANPLIDFDRLLVIRRAANALGLPHNWQSNCVLPRTGYKNEILALSPVSPSGSLTTVYKPADDTFVGDVKLHFDGDRILFSKSDPRKPWQVYELKLGETEPKRLTPDMGGDINNYDACYLPNGDLLFTSTAPMVAVPCVNGSTHVANLFRMSADGTQVRQLCFDQEHNWCPTLLGSGRVLYQRWEYADLPHSNSRLLFHMNPDGTSQMEFYGSNSYWPNSLFYARPIPGKPTQFVGIVTGHHGVPRMGELVLFDTARGRFEAEGAVQRIPGYGKKVERVVADQLVNASWPKFLHPCPLGGEDGKGSGKYFLAACQPTPQSSWGIYLVDIFDNLLLLKEEPGFAFLEPVPLKKTPAPPVIPDRVDLTRKDANVYLADIYIGPGLKGIPKGEVKALRVFTYVYGYRDLGGLYGTIGMDGPWDMRRVLGVVPVESDGSAFFRIPANTPVSIQPLDREGKALQVMRSWFVGMPGETISCVGCHEPQNSAPPVRRTIASQKAPTDLAEWYGKTRGFSFAREVQPVLDARCVSCHNGTTKYQGRELMSLRGDQPLQGWKSSMSGHQNANLGGKFTVGYANLQRFVRTPGIESDMHLLVPMDFHADSTELIQKLRKGHHDVKLSAEEWDRLVTWIDLNAPFHGDWATIAGNNAVIREKRRAEMRKAYAGVDDYHIDPAFDRPPAANFRSEVPAPKATANLAVSPPSFSRREPKTLDLGGGVTMTFVYVPAGEFVMGCETSEPDERPVAKVTIPQGFWMAETETTNRQYACFDPKHDSRREDKQGYQFGVEGYPLFLPEQPVVRISWRQAQAFAEWLSDRTGHKAQLPTEAQWEYACRAGTSTPFSFGDPNTDFSKFANLGDRKLKELASDPYTPDRPIPNPPVFDDWVPKDERFDDGMLVTGPVKRYQPNAWGLYDMHGNAAEWTLSEYRPYPYADGDGRNATSSDAPRVARGGSWRDRPQRCTSAYRYAYRPYQPVFNVGFRVILAEP